MLSNKRSHARNHTRELHKSAPHIDSGTHKTMAQEKCQVMFLRLSQCSCARKRSSRQHFTNGYSQEGDCCDQDPVKPRLKEVVLRLERLANFTLDDCCKGKQSADSSYNHASQPFHALLHALHVHSHLSPPALGASFLPPGFAPSSFPCSASLLDQLSISAHCTLPPCLASSLPR